MLSPELWARVLVQLRGNETGSATDAEDHEQLIERQQELLNLRLVCRLFKVLYDSEPHFISNLLLPDRFSIASIPSMIAWLQKHTANVQSVSAVFGSPFLEAILTGLLCHKTALTAVYLRSCTESTTIELLSNFQTLSQVELGFDGSKTMDLWPLLCLPALQALHLSESSIDAWCVFAMDRLPQHLTELALRWCELHIQPGSSCVTSLQSLKLCHGTLSGLHPNGLLACHGLQQLRCSSGCVMADATDDTLASTMIL